MKYSKCVLLGVKTDSLGIREEYMLEYKGDRGLGNVPPTELQLRAWTEEGDEEAARVLLQQSVGIEVLRSILRSPVSAQYKREAAEKILKNKSVTKSALRAVCECVDDAGLKAQATQLLHLLGEEGSCGN